MQEPTYADILRASGQPTPPPTTILALLDTGAMTSALDPLLTRQLQLRQHGTSQIHTPSTGPMVKTVRSFDARFEIGDPLTGVLARTVLVIEAEFASQGFLGLIGRDILNVGVLTYDGPAGAFSFSW